MSSVRSLIDGYRQSAFFLTRSANELEQLLKNCEAFPDEACSTEASTDKDNSDSSSANKRKLDETDTGKKDGSASEESNEHTNQTLEKTVEKVRNDEGYQPSNMKISRVESPSVSAETGIGMNQLKGNSPFITEQSTTRKESVELSISSHQILAKKEKVTNSDDSTTKVPIPEVLQPVPELLHLPSSDDSTEEQMKSPIRISLQSPTNQLQQQQQHHHVSQTTPVRITIAQPIHVENILKSPIVLHSSSTRGNNAGDIQGVGQNTAIITQSLNIVNQYQNRSPSGHLRQLQPILPRTQVGSTVLYAHPATHQVSANQHQQQPQPQQQQQQYHQQQHHKQSHQQQQKQQQPKQIILQQVQHSQQQQQQQHQQQQQQQPQHQQQQQQHQQQQQQHQQQQQQQHQQQQQQHQHQQRQQYQQQTNRSSHSNSVNISRSHSEHGASNIIPGQMYLIHSGNGSQQQMNRHMSEQSNRQPSTPVHHSGTHHQALQSAGTHQQTVFNFENSPQQLLEVRTAQQYTHSRVSPHSSMNYHHGSPASSPIMQGSRQSNEIHRQSQMSSADIQRQVHSDYQHNSGHNMVFDGHQSH